MRAAPTAGARPSRSCWAPAFVLGRHLALFAFVLFFLMPVYVLVVTSVKNPADVTVSRMWELPSSISLKGFQAVWPKRGPGFINSVLLAVPVSVISSVLGAANGFVLSKWRFPGADFVFPLILFGMFIPYQAILIPMVRTVSVLGMQGGLDGLIMVHIIYGLPITVALNNIAGGQQVPFEQVMASALLASIPTLLVYILLGRFFMRGLMAGSLKG